MRLLIAADIFPPESGGPATYAVTLANELVKQNDDVVIVSLNPKSDIKAIQCPVLAVKSNFKPLRYWQYYCLLKQCGRDVDVIYAMGPVNAGLPAWCAARKLGKKFIVKVVGDYAWEQGVARFAVEDLIDDFQKKHNYGFWVESLRWVEKMVAKKADSVIVPCKYLARMVENWGVNDERIKVIYNEVKYNVAEPIKHDNEKWLVTVGRLMPWKGMGVLIQVISNLSKQFPESRWKLKIIGDGPEMDKMKKKVLDNNLIDVVDLVGNLSNDKTLTYIASADVFILNSAYEGLSHVIVEAHNQGVPVIASDAGGNPEIVGSENLFEYNNKEEIEEKILQNSLAGRLKSMPHRFSTHMINDTRIILGKLCAN